VTLLVGCLVVDAVAGACSVMCVSIFSRPRNTILQVFCGVLLGAASLGLDTGDRWWGILLSALMMLNGAATWAGAAQRQLNLLSGGFAGGMLLLALAFNFMATLHRNAVVDCALAELLSMDNAARTRLSERSAWKDTAMETITSRIEALDQTLHVMEHRSDLLLPSKEIDREGAVKELKAEHQSALYAAQDARLIEKKLKKAKEHGVAVLQGLLKLGIDPKGKFAALEEATSVSLPAGDVDKLKQRFESLFRVSCVL
jgi:dolichyl-phosphate-mannose--protein O-mannosyl transferase